MTGKCGRNGAQSRRECLLCESIHDAWASAAHSETSMAAAAVFIGSQTSLVLSHSRKPWMATERAVPWYTATVRPWEVRTPRLQDTRDVINGRAAPSATPRRTIGTRSGGNDKAAAIASRIGPAVNAAVASAAMTPTRVANRDRSAASTPFSERN